MHDGKVVVIDGDVDDDVDVTEWRADVEPRVVESARYEPVNSLSIVAKGDATEVYFQLVEHRISLTTTTYCKYVKILLYVYMLNKFRC